MRGWINRKPCTFTLSCPEQIGVKYTITTPKEILELEVEHLIGTASGEDGVDRMDV